MAPLYQPDYLRQRYNNHHAKAFLAHDWVELAAGSLWQSFLRAAYAHTTTPHAHLHYYPPAVADHHSAANAHTTIA